MAGVRFVHTADLQLGKPFHGIPGDAGAGLRERRLDALDTIGRVAREHQADFVLVAGDFFDSNAASERDVEQALSRIRHAGVDFVVLPGNHDHAGLGSVYARPSFRGACPGNLVVLDRPEPHVLLGGRAVILPAPLRRKHTLSDPTAHLTPEFGRAEAPEAIRVGFAHGSVIDVGRDVDGRSANFIPPDRAERAELDYLALGDWHGMKRISDRTFYSGTPEPTGFRQNDPGRALLVDIAAPGAAPSVQPVGVAATRWLEREETVLSMEDVLHLESWFEAFDAPHDVLVRLALDGRLGREERERLDRLLETMSHRLLHLDLSSEVRVTLSEDDLAEVAVDGVVRTAINRLRDIAASSEPRARAAERALLTLHHLALAEGGAAC
jgi:DNA repair exonuclease SbcCD nuclease subunit